MPHSEEIQAWLDKGDSDLASARVLLDHAPSITDTATFHCQQAAEKYLKAFLIDHNVAFERVHNLVYLLDLCIDIDKNFDSLKESAALLTPFAVLARYPGDNAQPTVEQAEEAYKAALSITGTIESMF